jgi:hypothetical protein
LLPLQHLGFQWKAVQMTAQRAIAPNLIMVRAIAIDIMAAT